MLDEKTIAKYLPTIGIECHVQLATKTKLFSDATNDADDKEPNLATTLIDFGLPGTLPVLNHEAVNLTVRAGLAMNCEIAQVSRFDRKHYFYPDLPKGYQISQFHQPIIGAGVISIDLPDGKTKKVRIHHAHLEEDAGKLTHTAGAEYSLVDFNRAGTPLIEIVSEPDLNSSTEAKAYAQELYLLMVYAGVTHGNLYRGNMRFDVNVSVAKPGEKLGKRAEVKNLNSFRSVERAVEYEIKRQIELIEKGKKVDQETRGWDDAKQKTTSQRSKEEAQDYRYMPEPDVPPIIVSSGEVQKAKSNLPMLPPEYRNKWQELNLDSSVITALLADPSQAKLVSQTQDAAGDSIARRIAHWLATVAAEEEVISEGSKAKLKPEPFIELAKMVESSELNSTAAKEVFLELLGGATSPRDIAKEKNLLQVSDESAILDVVKEVLESPESQKAVADIKAGQEKAIGFLVGQVMKKSKGKANPALAQKLIKQQISS